MHNPTLPEHILREKLRKIDALFASTATAGEKTAAGAAAERMGRFVWPERPRSSLNYTQPARKMRAYVASNLDKIIPMR